MAEGYDNFGDAFQDLLGGAYSNIAIRNFLQMKMTTITIKNQKKLRQTNFTNKIKKMLLDFLNQEIN
ncbi:MAG: hypothetical protein EBU08_16730 [Micrococcales bacterium]|nr:hypothetical protein [Micrococcales bacterium]